MRSSECVERYRVRVLLWRTRNTKNWRHGRPSVPQYAVMLRSACRSVLQYAGTAYDRGQDGVGGGELQPHSPDLQENDLICTYI